MVYSTIELLLFLMFSKIFIVNSTFQTSIFAKINKSFKAKNVIISPISIFQALSLTANGAKTLTQEEMLKVLGTKNIEELNNSNFALDKLREFSSIEMANAIMTKFIPLRSFIKIAGQYSVELKDLKSIEEVNGWCNIKTHGKIKKILNELDPNLLMLILNAIYFKGFWTEPFKEKLTTEAPFYNLNQESQETKIKFMAQTNDFNYYEDKKIQVVELHYKDDFMSALIILPKKEIDINSFIENLDLNENVYSGIIENFKNEEVTIKIPKFEITFESSLKDTLYNMGMKNAFAGNADFRGIRAQNDLFVGDVRHKTYLKVDEYGTEAAAITVVQLMKNAYNPIPKKKHLMIVNRPFLFIIRNRRLPKFHDIIFIAKIEKLD